MSRSVLCLLLLSAAAPVHAAASLGIPVPPGTSSVAYDINSAGQIAAVLEDARGRQCGVLAEPGKLTALRLIANGESDAHAINAAGTVVGSAKDAQNHWHAYLYDHAHGLRTLDALGGTDSYGLAINRAGHVVGYADTRAGGYHAFLYDGRQMRDLGTLGGTLSNANGINDAGQVVGSANLRNDSRHAFVYDAAHGMVDLGTLGGPNSAAAAINDKGVIVGASETGNRIWHAFLYDGHRMYDLGALIGEGESFANGINNAGEVAGTVQTAEERRSFVWRAGKMTVYRGGQGLFQVNRVTDAGQVVGAIRGTRLEAAVLSSSAVPQEAPNGLRVLLPIALFSLLTAGLVILWRRRYRGLSWRVRRERR